MDSEILPTLKLDPEDQKSFQLVISEDTVKDFMSMSGDTNPIHWNKDYCELTYLKQPIAHGGILIAALSKYLGVVWPGPGTMITKLSSKFKAPMFIGDRIHFHLSVGEPGMKGYGIDVKCVKFKKEPTGRQMKVTSDIIIVAEMRAEVVNVWDITRSKARKQTKDSGADSTNSSKEQSSVDAVSKDSCGGCPRKV